MIDADHIIAFLRSMDEPEMAGAISGMQNRLDAFSDGMDRDCAAAMRRAFDEAVRQRGDMSATLKRLERAVDLHLGRSSWTQTAHLKGAAHGTAVRTELFAAHDAARAALASLESAK
jgi:hypothetical protein